MVFICCRQQQQHQYNLHQQQHHRNIWCLSVADSSNNTNITFTNNNITGTTGYGVALSAYDNKNANFTFVDNTIIGNSNGLYVTSNSQDFANLTFVNNTVNGTNGINFVSVSALEDILISGNNISGTTGIAIASSVAFVDNVIVNYNRILANTGLNTNKPIDADYNWWGKNNPTITGQTLNNWFAMVLSEDSFWTINTASINRTGTVLLTYDFLLYTNSTNSTSSEDFGILPNFLISITWGKTGGIIHEETDVWGLGTYSYSVPIVSGSDYYVNARGDNSNFRLVVTYATSSNNTTNNTTNNNNTPGGKITPNDPGTNGNSTPKNTNTINIPNNVRVGKTVKITGTATDQNGNPLSNVALTVTVNGKAYTVTTNSKGGWVLSYKPTKAGNLIVSVSWAGNKTHKGFTVSSRSSVAKRSTNSDSEDKDGNNALNSDKNNKNRANSYSNNPAAAAAMKKTGSPIAIILLVLLSCVGIIYKKK